MAYFLTKSLAGKGISVSVLNEDMDLCEAIARNPNILTVCAEQTDPRYLADAGAHRADVTVSLAEDDAENFMVSRLAKVRFDCPRTVALVHDPTYQRIFRDLGIDVAVSVVDILGSLLQEHLMVQAITDMIYIEDGRLVVSEVLIPCTSPSLHEPLRDLDLPQNTILAAILRRGSVIVPRGDTSVEPNDRVVLVTEPKSHSMALRILVGENNEE